MSLFDELAFLDATAQAELVRRKQLKPIELVDAAIARIERLNPKLNAVITPMFEEARNAVHSSIPERPFSGVHGELQIWPQFGEFSVSCQDGGSARSRDPFHPSHLGGRHVCGIRPVTSQRSEALEQLWSNLRAA